jgi:hypothetical protein
MGQRDTMALLDQYGHAIRSPKVPPANPNMAYTGVSGGTTWGIVGARKGALVLRRFSERNVWVRVAINRRKRSVAKSGWKIVRLDDPHAKPDAGIVKKIGDLFRFVNDTRASFNQLIAMAVEDILVLDAGVIEKERTAGGEVIALWPVSGDEIMPLVGWDGSNPKKPRYVQIREGREVARYLNDELIYMMVNPRTCSPIGLSPVENLVATIEADLYGEYFEYQLMKETAPAGILYLGGGVPPNKVEAFRTQWEADIAGTRDVAIIGGGGYDPETGSVASPPEFIPFGRSGKDEQRREYMKWLATKVAAAFEMDLMAFNLSETVHRSIGESLQQKTDEGLLGLASVVESYVTREIVWEFDPNHEHGFAFTDLTPQDEMAKAKLRNIYMDMGCTTPNEIRAEDGLPPVAWGDEPWPGTVQAKAEDPAQEGLEPEDDSTSGGGKPADDDEDD